MNSLNNYSANSLVVGEYKINYFDFGDVKAPNSIYIQGQLHANEVNTFSTLHGLVEKLKLIPPPVPLRIVPSCNPIGWDIHLNGKDGRVSYPGNLDWNRIFNTPLFVNDTLEKNLAKELWTLSNGFSRIFDVHTPDYGFPHIYTSDIRNRMFTFEDLPYIINDKSIDGSFQNLNTIQRKIPSFTLEIPSYEIWTSSSQEYWINRIHAEIIACKKRRNIVLPVTPKYFGQLISLYSNISGVPLLLVQPNKVAKKDSKIIRVTSSNGEDETIVFGNDCIPLCFRRKGLIQAGRMVAKVLSLH